MPANDLTLAPRRALRLEKLCVDLIEVTIAVLPRSRDSAQETELVLDEWDLRQVFNIPNIRFDPALAPYIPPGYGELSQPVAYCYPELGHWSSGFRPELLTRTCEVLLRGWEQGALPESRRIQVETAAILYWELAGGGADATTRAIFQGPEPREQA